MYFLSNLSHCVKNYGRSCQILSFFTMPACQIWSCHITQNANFENVLFCPNSTFNIGKVTKFLVESSLVQKLLGKNFMGWGGGGGNTLIPSASRVKSRDDLPPSKPFLIIVLQINIFFCRT